jgi:L-threonine kinase
MEAITFYPGSCGEVLQGRLDGRDMLVSCPVNLFTSVRVFETKSPGEKDKHTKASALLQNTLKAWGYESLTRGLDIAIKSQIPRGKGFASSTADLCGTYYSLAKLLNVKPDREELLRECIRIEPTDSILFDKMTLLDYKEGNLFIEMGEYMEFHILVFEGKRVVDTIGFNNSNLPSLEDISEEFLYIKRGIIENNLSLLATASTASIMKNQNRLSYEILPDVLKLKDRTGGLGILGGHSGDVLGIIYEDEVSLQGGLKFKDSINGYRGYSLRTLRSVNYESNNDYSTLKW